MTCLLAGAVVCLLAGNGVTSPADTGTIRGRVVSTDDGKPLARAEVHLAGDQSRAVLTDDKGRYAFTDLPAGRFTVSAGRTGYVTLGYGQPQSTDTLQPIALAAGESRAQVDFALSHGGVIEVTVVDQFGDPVEGAYVRAWRDRAPDQTAPAEEPRLEPAQSALSTDDRGRARLYDLSPGTYFLTALPLHTPSVPLQDRGGVNPRPVRYQRTFYPGTTVAKEAEPVALVAGHELSVSIPIRPTLIEEPVMPAAPPVIAATASRAAPGVEATGRISGRIMPQDGPRPLSHAIVTLSSVENFPISRVQLADDDGRYEFAGLPDGAYTVSAARPGFLTRAYGQRPPWMTTRTVRVAGGSTVGPIDLTLPEAAVITVRVTDEFGHPRAGLHVALLRAVTVRGRRQLTPARLPRGIMDIVYPREFQTDDRGETRSQNLPPGDYFVRVEPHPFPIAHIEASPKDSTRELIEPPTYFPGTTLASEAQPVTVHDGQELTVAIPIAATLAAHVSGAVINADGTPGRGTVVLHEDALDGGSGSELRDELVGGTFTFWNLQPGDYLIEKRVDEPGLPQDQYGSIAVTVAGENISDLVLTTAPPGTLEGRAIFDTGSPPEDLDPADQSIEARDAESAESSRTTMTSDWSFTLERVTVPSLLQLDGGWHDWVLKEVTLAGADVTEVPLQTAADLRVVVTRQSVITGTIIDRTGATIIDCGVMLFAADGGRPIAATSTNYLGLFRFGGLLPGHYFIAQVAKAATDEPGAGEPASRARLEQIATPVTIGAGETRMLTLTLSLPDQDPD